MKIPYCLKITWKIISSVIDGIFAYLGVHLVLSSYMKWSGIVEITRANFGLIGEWLIITSPIWLPIPAGIVITYELASYRMAKLKASVNGS